MRRQPTLKLTRRATATATATVAAVAFLAACALASSPLQVDNNAVNTVNMINAVNVGSGSGVLVAGGDSSLLTAQDVAPQGIPVLNNNIITTTVETAASASAEAAISATTGENDKNDVSNTYQSKKHQHIALGDSSDWPLDVATSPKSHPFGIVVAASSIVMDDSMTAPLMAPPPSTPPPADERGIEFLHGILSKPSGSDYCMPRGMIRDSCCDYEDVESINNEIRPMLRQLTEMPFFRYYTIQLYKDCPFWVEEMACNNPQCSVYPSEAKTIPSVWRNGRVSAKDASFNVNPSKNGNGNGNGEGSGSYFGMSLNQIKQKLMPKASTSKEFAILEDTESPDAIHVDLIHNPERFTGYAGPSANRIWKSIYEDNCFGLVSGQAAGDAAGWGDQVTRLNGTVDPFSVPPAHKEQLSEFLENLAQARDAATNSTTPGGHALREYWMLYRIVSGLHASISTHLCNEYYDKTTEQWGPNLDCFVSRIGSHPERLENIYFNYAIVLRAVARASKYLRHYDLTGYDSNGHSKHRIGKADSKKTGPIDLQTRQKLHKVLDVTKAVTQTFNETEFFRGREGPKRLEVVKETFRNVSRIMDCVGCEKCRLWGKVQVGGVAAALKILFSYSAKDIASTNTVSISRNEIVALINVFNQFSKSLEAIGRFRTMYQERVSTAIAAAAAASEEKKKKVKTSTTATTPVPPLEQQQSSHSTADEAASSAPHSTVETERQTRPAHDEL